MSPCFLLTHTALAGTVRWFRLHPASPPGGSSCIKFFLSFPIICKENYHGFYWQNITFKIRTCTYKQGLLNKVVKFRNGRELFQHGNTWVGKVTSSPTKSIFQSRFKSLVPFPLGFSALCIKFHKISLLVFSLEKYERLKTKQTHQGISLQS